MALPGTAHAAGAKELLLERLFHEHAEQVSRWAQSLGGPGADVEDIVQEVYLVAHRGLDGFRGESKATTWLFGITANVIRGRRRKERWRSFLSGDAEEIAGELASEQPTAPEELERREEAARVYRVLDRMGEKYRTALILFEMEERSAEEIAQLTGAKVGTVFVWLHRARAEFLKQMQALEEEGWR